MYTITKEFHFSASHILHGLSDNHPCSRLHGHNYILKVELKAINLEKSTGFVKDYRELDVIKNWIDDNLDHRHLNDVFGGMQPSSENIWALPILLYHKVLTISYEKQVMWY